MKEISKYMNHFMNSAFDHEFTHNYSISPDVSSFFSEKYNEIVDAYNEWNKNKNTILLRGSTIDFTSNNEWKSGIHYSYLQKNVKEYLETSPKIGIKYEFSVFEQDISLYIVYPLEDNEPMEIISPKKLSKYYENIVCKVYLWIHVANKYRVRNCSQKLDIYLYLTNMVKLLSPNSIIGRFHANTGFTTPCDSSNEIYVFREEEWFKVLIHESFHSFGMDFSHPDKEHIQNTCEKQIHHIFNIPDVNVLVFETFNELCAEIIHLLFFYFFHSKSYSEPIIEKLLNKEMSFSAFQCAKVLNHYSLKYTDLYSHSPESIKKINNYRENTNVFAYYILKSLLLNHLNEFVSWLTQSNQSSFQFIPTAQNTSAFCDMIRTIYDDPEYVEKLDTYSNWFELHKKDESIEAKTLRMTIHE